jgi:hypothetical protein
MTNEMEQADLEIEQLCAEIAGALRRGLQAQPG